MFINPKVAIEKGWITGIKDPAKQVQPNAIDFTLDKLMLLGAIDLPRISETDKRMRPLYEVETAYVNRPIWHLDGLKVYDGTSDMYVEVPEGVVAILYTRSTFARNGVFIMSGLYDSGFKGHVGFTIYTVGGAIEIEQGTRIGQIAFISSENAGMYVGSYNHDRIVPVVVPGLSGGISSVPAPDAPAGFGSPTLMEQPVEKVEVSFAPGNIPAVKGEVGQKLEETHKWDSDQVGQPAGQKTFL